VALLVVLLGFIPLMPALLIFSLIPKCDGAGEPLNKLKDLFMEILRDDGVSQTGGETVDRRVVASPARPAPCSPASAAKAEAASCSCRKVRPRRSGPY